ncbi:MAG: ribosome biogenesis/translation initiation ATPase RLI, partial [Nanoarchaeota archaeon]|nr:ribosome biogenesis/translation initiation ATPase RLI [Nanoarchaeota archaeon]
MHIVVIKENECEAPSACNYICYNVCPQVRKGLKETVYKRENGKAAINEELCIACGICVKRCPFEAIRVINLPDETGKELVFQYGINSFRTYNIASPMEGRIVALIGRNGIGKTTNIKLISGELRPNFGEFNKEHTEKEIIQRFRGKDVQPYLEKIYSGRLKISKKPQEFRLEGKVKDIVKSNRFGLIDEDLLYKEDASLLSGGEGQLVRIAQTLDEEADVYIFDEPMNFLDISQRLRVSRTIREKLKGKTVVVAEHDLLAVDYMADFVQVLYGSDSNYGIVSHVMPTRSGINNYIYGYLPDENVRFRSYQINMKKESSSQSIEVSFSWPDFNIKLGSFTLDVKAGSLPKGEIVGAIGENGIGKTTFLKGLAGLVETDIGRLDFGIRISYKPQIIERVDMIVSDVFSSIDKNFGDNEVFQDMIRKLELNRVLNKNIKNLSGGELQKVAIVSSLMRDADLYVLDEPSANLDVEDRLSAIDIFNAFIKSRQKSAIVVDHDLVFIDSIAS